MLDGNATEETLDVIRLTAEGIYYSADCAIGYEAAKLVLNVLMAVRMISGHILREDLFM